MAQQHRRPGVLDDGSGNNFAEAIEIPEIVEPACRHLAGLRFSDLVEVACNYDWRTERYKLLDINTRPRGWQVPALTCGLDFPWIQHCEALHELPTLPTPALWILLEAHSHRWPGSDSEDPGGHDVSSHLSGLAPAKHLFSSLIGGTPACSGRLCQCSCPYVLSLSTGPQAHTGLPYARSPKRQESCACLQNKEALQEK